MSHANRSVVSRPKLAEDGRRRRAMLILIMYCTYSVQKYVNEILVYVPYPIPATKSEILLHHEPKHRHQHSISSPKVAMKVKRAAEHQINKDEYEANLDEPDTETPEGMSRANEDVIKKRKIVKAR